MHRFIVWLLSIIIFSALYGWTITPLNERKEMYLGGATVFAAVLLIYLAGRLIWKKRGILLHHKNIGLALTPKKIAWAGLVMFLVAGLYPPWKKVFDARGVHLEEPAGYSFLFMPPEDNRIEHRYLASVKVDLTRLGIQWTMLAVGFGVASLRKKEPGKEESR